MRLSTIPIATGFFLGLTFLLVGFSAQAKPPNIVVILTDDLSQEVFGHASKIHSLLGANGTRFENHYISLPLCCPSRAAILRGQYAHNTGIYTNAWPDGGFAKVYRDGLESSTVATWLQAGGYRTALIGKYLNGYPNAASGTTYIPPGWTRWVSPNGGDPYSQYGYTLNQNGTTVTYGNADYLEDVLSRKTAAFIRNTTARFPGKPFFLYVATYLPHGPATPPPRYARDLRGLKAPRTAAFDEADVSDKPAWIRNKPLLAPVQIAKMSRLYRKRRIAMRVVEDLVQTVVDTLKATKQLDNTYLFFTSDNGFHQGQHRLFSGKNTAFEEDIKVPLVVRGPGVPPGRSVARLTANVDLAPTWAELAGITPPGFVDGRSLAPFLKGETPPAWRQVLLLEHGGPSLTPARADPLLEPQDAFDAQAMARGGAPAFAGLRTSNRLSYVEYDTGERELYDLATDPDQLVNIHATADPALRTALSAWLGSLRHTAGQSLRNAEQRPPQPDRMLQFARKKANRSGLKNHG